MYRESYEAMLENEKPKEVLHPEKWVLVQRNSSKGSSKGLKVFASWEDFSGNYRISFELVAVYPYKGGWSLVDNRGVTYCVDAYKYGTVGARNKTALDNLHYKLGHSMMSEYIAMCMINTLEN